MLVWPKVYFDGSAGANPGILATAVWHNGIEMFSDPLRHKKDTSVDAEYEAAFTALQFASQIGASHILMIGDCEVVINALDRGYFKGMPKFESTWVDIKALEWSGFTKVRWRHVRRDKNLAGVALDKELRKRGRAVRDAGIIDGDQV